MTGSTASRVSAVVLTWNNRDLIDDCLDSIRRLDWPDVEIVVVDNGSRDGTAEHLRTLPDIRLLELPRNLGFAGGQVRARPLITGEHVALVNSDAVVGVNWLRELVSAMSDPAVGAAGGRAYQWEAGTEPGRTDVPYYSYQVVDPMTGRTVTRTSGDLARDVDAISGAAVLIRTAALDAVGGFDRRFFAYYEETDLFARMIRAGYRIRYVPGAHAWHQLRASTQDNPRFYTKYMTRNQALFFLRNFDQPYRRAAWRAYLADAWHRLRTRHPAVWDVARALGSLVLLAPHVRRSRAQIARLGDAYCTRLPGDPTGGGEEA